MAITILPLLVTIVRFKPKGVTPTPTSWGEQLASFDDRIKKARRNKGKDCGEEALDIAIEAMVLARTHLEKRYSHRIDWDAPIC